MNYWLNEVTAEARREEILALRQEIRLAEQAQPLRTARTGLYGRSMLKLADWMIAAGRDLRCRYDLRSVDCNRSATGSFAR